LKRVVMSMRDQTKMTYTMKKFTSKWFEGNPKNILVSKKPIQKFSEH
jgi:hypothetical protein